jgi:hypothetical protein
MSIEGSSEKRFIYREDPEKEGRETLQTHSKPKSVEQPDTTVKSAEVPQDGLNKRGRPLGEDDETG